MTDIEEYLLHRITATEAVSVTQLVSRLDHLHLSRAAMRRHLRRLVNGQHLQSRPRGGVTGGRRLYSKPRNTVDEPVGVT